MTYTPSNFTKVFTISSALSVLPLCAWATIDCSTLASHSDQMVCQEVVDNRFYANGEDWLDSVQKIPSGTEITQELLSNTNRLYIFDSAVSNGQRAIYNFPPTINLPANTAVISNGTETFKPKFILETSEEGNQFSVTEGYNLVQNVEISANVRSTGSGIQQLFFASGIQGMTLSGVTLSGDYTPSDSDVISTYALLSIGNSSGGVANIFVTKSDFLLPDVGPVNHQTVLIGVLVQGALSSHSNQDLTILDFKENRIITRDYNKEGGMVASAAMSILGFVRLYSSTCNVISDYQGQDLLSESNFGSWIVGSNNTINNQAIGFRNGYGWGWREENDQTFYRYDTWDGWTQFGVDLTCNQPTRPPLLPTTAFTSNTTALSPTNPDTPSGQTSDDIGLAVIVAVPVITAVVVLGVAITGIFGARHLWKRWNSSRIQRALTGSLEKLTQ